MQYNTIPNNLMISNAILAILSYTLKLPAGSLSCPFGFCCSLLTVLNMKALAHALPERNC